jgi:hypothetical protein
MDFERENKRVLSICDVHSCKLEAEYRQLICLFNKRCTVLGNNIYLKLNIFLVIWIGKFGM